MNSVWVGGLKKKKTSIWLDPLEILVVLLQHVLFVFTKYLFMVVHQRGFGELFCVNGALQQTLALMTK